MKRYEYFTPVVVVNDGTDLCKSWWIKQFVKTYEDAVTLRKHLQTFYDAQGIKVKFRIRPRGGAKIPGNAVEEKIINKYKRWPGTEVPLCIAKWCCLYVYKV